MTIIKYKYYGWHKGEGKSRKTFPCNSHVTKKKSVPWFVTQRTKTRRIGCTRRNEAYQKQRIKKADSTRDSYFTQARTGKDVDVCLFDFFF